MNTLLENLEEIKALFLLNKHDNDLVTKLLTKLQRSTQIHTICINNHIIKIESN